MMLPALISGGLTFALLTVVILICEQEKSKFFWSIAVGTSAFNFAIGWFFGA